MSEFLEYTSDLSDFLKTISDKTRLQIIELLKYSDNGMNAAEIMDRLDKSQSTISQHLKMLDDKNLLTVEKRGNINYYKIKDPFLSKILSQIKSFIANMHKEKLKELRDSDRLDALS